LIGEWLIADQARATADTDAPLRHTSLRYFNVVGSADPSVYDTSPHNLFPIVFEKLIAGETPRINGDDYDTPDGTNVRDYVHVGDIAAAHVAAAQRLIAGEPIE
ncbi:MAG TPA: UDP-glucose 4-epimerase GalE, partial [Microbacterium sp.]|nr:UDP-glucose 4-epimerase GalE [Microbacterium sp.]